MKLCVKTFNNEQKCARSKQEYAKIRKMRSNLSFNLTFISDFDGFSVPFL